MFQICRRIYVSEIFHNFPESLCTYFVSRIMKMQFSTVSIRGRNCVAFSRVARIAVALRATHQKKKKKKKKEKQEYSMLVEAVDSRTIKDIKFLLRTLLRCHVHFSTPQLSVWTE